MELKDCTKADLLWIISQIRKDELSYRRLQWALNDLEHEKEKKRLDRAHQLLQVSSAASQRYTDLLRPYEGKPLVDVTMEVLKEADAALDEYNTANKQWAKLMGVK